MHGYSLHNLDTHKERAVESKRKVKSQTLSRTNLENFLSPLASH